MSVDAATRAFCGLSVGGDASRCPSKDGYEAVLYPDLRARFERVPTRGSADTYLSRVRSCIFAELALFVTQARELVTLLLTDDSDPCRASLTLLLRRPRPPSCTRSRCAIRTREAS